MNDAVQSKIFEILSKHSELSKDHYTPETPLEEAGIDSLAMMEIIFDLEEAFDITMPDEFESDGSKLQTAGDVVREIQSLLEKGKPSE